MTKLTDDIKLNGEKIWNKAKKSLEKKDLNNFMHHCRELREFHQNKNAESLDDLKLSKEATKMAQILKQNANIYARHINCPHESEIINNIHSDIALFLDFTRNDYKDIQDETVLLKETNKNLDDKTSYLALMEQAKAVAPKKFQTLMQAKINQLKNITASGDLLKDAIRKVLGFRGFSQDQKDYMYKFYKPTFFHASPVKANNFADVKSQYLGLRGDMLKARILSDLVNKLSKKTTSEAVENTFNEFKNSTEYNILNTAQGLSTKLLRWLGIDKKTDSVKAADSICENIKNEKNSPAF